MMRNWILGAVLTLGPGGHIIAGTATIKFCDEYGAIHVEENRYPYDYGGYIAPDIYGVEVDCTGLNENRQGAAVRVE